MRPTSSVVPPVGCSAARVLNTLLWSVLLLTLHSLAWAAPATSPVKALRRLPARTSGQLKATPVRGQRLLKANAVAPAAPSGLGIYTYPAPTSIQLYWTSNSTNESSFAVERKVDGQPDTSFTPVGSADAVDSAGTRAYFTDSSGLAFDTVYDYRVRAIASDGTPSDYSNVTSGTTAPASPTLTSVVPVSSSDSQLTLTFTDNAHYTSYFQIWRKGPGETTFTNTANTDGTTGTPGYNHTVTFTDTGLTVNSAYSYYVIAYNGAGQSDPSATLSGTTLTTQAPPAAPSLNGYMTDKTSARVYFYDRSTNGTSVTLQRIDNDDPSSVYTDLPGYPKADTGGYNTFYDNSDTGLAVDTSYSYRAFASNIKGDSAYSTILTVDTVPVKPTLTSVVPVSGSDSQLTLTFTDNAHYTSYFQIWREGPGETTFTNTANTDGTTGTPGYNHTVTFTDTGLTVNSAYSYYVIAYNGAGQSDPSATLSGTTNVTQAPPAAPSLNGYMTDKTSARVYFYDRSTNGTSVTLQRIDNDDPSSVYTDLPGYPKADTGGYNTFYDNSDTGLTVDTSYSYRAFASNAAGDSGYSTILTVDTVPVKPTLTSVVPVSGSDSQLTLTFTDNAHYTSYFQIWREGPGETTFTNTANTDGTTGTPGYNHTVTFTDTGLTVNSAYSYYVIAYNGAGQSDPSATLSGTTNVTQAPPAAPSLNGYMTDKTSARVYFYDRSTNGTSVTLQRIDNDDPSSVYTDLPGYPKADTGGYNTFYDNSDTGLAVDTSYSYRAFASNIKGDSGYSTILTVDTVPVKPISVQAAGISDTKIKLTFTDNAHYTSYFQIWREGPGETTFTNTANTDGTTGTPGYNHTVTFTDTGLTVNSAYSYYVIAYNGAGQSDPSATVTATSFPSNPPGAPTDLRAAGAAGPTQINLNWLDNSSDEYGFIVEREAETETVFTALPSPAAGANPGDPTVGPQPGTGRVYFSDKTAKDDTTYTYRVKATNPAGDSAYSNTAAATTPPTTPTGLSGAAVAGTDNSIKLSFTSSSKHEDGFNVYREAAGATVFTKAGFVPAAAGPGSAVSFTDLGLTSSTAYSYYVTAYNAAGESAPTSTIVVTSGTTVPTTAIISSPANNAKFHTGDTVTVVVTATPAFGTTITSYTLLLDNVATTQTTGTFTLTGLAAGTHTLKATVLDSAGNTATASGIAITVSNQPPVITNATISPATITEGGGTITVSATITDPNGGSLNSILGLLLLNGVNTVDINLSNGGSGNVYTGTYAAPANTSGATDTYTARVQAQNTADLLTSVDATGSTTQTSGNVVPNLSSLSPISAPVGTTGLTLTLKGTGFLAASTVSFGTVIGLVPVAGSITATQLQVAIPDSALTVGGALTVTVTNPAPLGGTSNGLTFTVSLPIPVAPVLQSATPGDGSVSLTFTAVANAATYDLKSATTAGGPYTVDATGITPAVGATTVTATDPNQANGVKKYYVVSAVGTGGKAPIPTNSAPHRCISTSRRRSP